MGLNIKTNEIYQKIMLRVVTTLVGNSCHFDQNVALALGSIQRKT